MAAKREIMIYDEIGPESYGLLGGSWMADELARLGNGDVTVRINSPGGSVPEALAIYNALLRHDGTVRVVVDSLAASCAALIAMAGKSIEMASASYMMVHNAWAFSMGNAEELRRQAELLDKADGMQVAMFAARTKQGPEQIKQWLDAETWMTAEEAVARGFADKIGQAFNGVAASIAHDRFKHVPAALAARVGVPATQDTLAARAARRKLALARARSNA